MVAQRILVLLLLIKVTVSTEVVKLVGSSVKLDIQKHVEKFDEIIWKYTDKIVFKYYNGSKELKRFNDRAEFSKTTYSLTLKNLKKSDSGRYEARISGETEGTVAEYTLSVLDPVETPVLTTVTDQQNSDTCNITLTCTGHDLSVRSNCFNGTCEEKEMTSSEGITLLLSVRNSSSVICYISNSVSRKMRVMDMKDIKQLCHPKDEQPQNDGFDWKIFTIIIIIMMIIIVLVVVLMKWKRKKTQSEDIQPGITEYAEVQNRNSAVTSESNECPSTLYDTVKLPQRSESEEASGTSPNMKQDSVERPNPQPETIYSTVVRATK